MKENKKIIFGIYCSTFDNAFGCTIPYVNYFEKWGYIRLINHLDNLDDALKSVDVLVVPGGADVDPKRYNQKPHIYTNNPNNHYEYLDQVVLSKWISSAKPLIGICRGMQSINVALGGTLIQHIKNNVQSENRNKTPQELYTDMNGYHIHKINTFHHQCVDKLASELQIIGWTSLSIADSKQYGKKWNNYAHLYEVDENKKIVKDDKSYYIVPELVIGKSLPILACQWHPEEYDCKLFNELVENLLKENFNYDEDINEIQKKALA